MIKVIRGDNFSGRTFYLKCLTGYPSQSVKSHTHRTPILSRDKRLDLYLGPIPDNHLTGVFSSVREELFRYRTNDDERLAFSLLESLGRSDLMERNPFTLSGGERTLVVTLSHVLRKPKVLAIDTTLEQLGNTWKTLLLEAVSKADVLEAWVADNRQAELVTKHAQHVDHDNLVEPLSVIRTFGPVDAASFRDFPEQQPQHLDVADLVFSYGRRPIFQSFSLKLEGGQIYHLRGRNGAGKSTLAKLLCGVIKPGRGTTMRLNGALIRPYVHPGQVVGYSFQSPDEQFFTNKVEGELMDSKKGRSDQALGESVARAFGLKEVPHVHPFDLPVVMRKRLSLAATLAQPRPFYILDEPTLYQDDRTAVAIARIIQALAHSGVGIVVISHSSSFITHFNSITTIDLDVS